MQQGAVHGPAGGLVLVGQLGGGGQIMAHHGVRLQAVALRKGGGVGQQAVPFLLQDLSQILPQVGAFLRRAGSGGGGGEGSGVVLGVIVERGRAVGDLPAARGSALVQIAGHELTILTDDGGPGLTQFIPEEQLLLPQLFGVKQAVPHRVVQNFHPGNAVKGGLGQHRKIQRAGLLGKTLRVGGKAPDDHGLGGLPVHGQGVFHGRGGKGIVRIAEGDLLAFGQRKALVAGGGNPGVFLVHRRKAGVFLLPGIADGAAFVGGTIVNEQAFPIPEGLPGNARQAAVQPGGSVVHRHDDAQGQGGSLYACHSSTS